MQIIGQNINEIANKQSGTFLWLMDGV